MTRTEDDARRRVPISTPNDQATTIARVNGLAVPAQRESALEDSSFRRTGLLVGMAAGREDRDGSREESLVSSHFYTRMLQDEGRGTGEANRERLLAPVLGSHIGFAIARPSRKCQPGR